MLITSDQFRHDVGRVGPLTPGILINTGVNLLPLNNPPQLSPSELDVLAKGDRFIPAHRKHLQSAEVTEAITALRRRAFIAERFGNDVYTPKCFKGTHVPYRIYNMSREESLALTKLRSRSDLVIRPADKNLGLTVMSKSWYLTACERILSDPLTYAKVGPFEENRAQAFARRVFSRMKALLSHHDINDAFAKRILGDPDLSRIPKFYIIPKLHKLSPAKPFEARPLVSQVNSPTERASALLSDYLVGVVGVNHPWIIRDTLEFLGDIDALVIPPSEETWLVTVDVVSLYPSMNRARVVQAVFKAVVAHETKNSSHATLAHPTATFISDLLTLVLDYGLFEFDDGTTRTLFNQITGSIMGVKCIPPCANLFMAQLLDATIHNQRWSRFIAYMKGFIDDGFLVWSSSLAELNEFMLTLNSLDANIKFTHSASLDAVPFLDVLVFKGPRFATDRHLDYRPFVKEHNKFLYIPLSSAHPPHCLTGFIAGEARRLIRNSSDETYAVDACIQLFAHLLERGYPPAIIMLSLRKVSYLLRDSYLVRKPVDVNARKTVAFVLPYRPNIGKLTLGRHLFEIERQLGSASFRVVMGWRSSSNLHSQLHLQWPSS